MSRDWMVLLQELFEQTALEDIKKRLEAALEFLIKNYYENDRELLNYLSGAVSGIAARLMEGYYGNYFRV